MVDFAALRTTMVDTQVRPSDVTRYPVIDAMLRIPREDFVPDTLRDAAYAEENIPLGEGRVVLAPRIVGKMLDALDISPDEMVLDIGAGLGYVAALLSRLAEAVVALEEDPALADEAERLLADHGAHNVALIQGALGEGAPRHGPFDAIVIEGGVERVPEAIRDQLKEGGRMAAIFMGPDGLGACRIGHKHAGAIDWRFAFNAAAPVLPGFEAQRPFRL